MVNRLIYYDTGLRPFDIFLKFSGKSNSFIFYSVLLLKNLLILIKIDFCVINSL